MLYLLINRYFIVAIVLYFIFLLKISSYFLPLYLLHIFAFILYAGILTVFSRKQNAFFLKSRLSMTVFLVSLGFVALNNVASFLYEKDFFVFSKADAFLYHIISLNMTAMGFIESLNYISNFWQFEDFGMVIVTSTLYRLISSNLFLNLTYVLVGVFTAKAIYRISSNFMTTKYAFVCALSYSLSSFVLWFHSSGLKESFMCFLVILFFDRYYCFMKNKRLSDIVYAAIFLSGLLLFRPFLIFFCIAAVGMGVLLQRKKGTAGALIIILIFTAFVAGYPLFGSTYEKFLMGGDLSGLLTAKEAMVKGGLFFTYAVNLTAQLIGPLPTISPDTKEMLSFFVPGLIFKILLSFIFWMAVYHIFKLKADWLYPLVFFTFLEMVALLLIIEGLELRKSLPHFFSVYIAAFWFLDKYDLTNLFKKKHLLKLLFNFSAIITFFIILAWNIRYEIL